MNSTKNIETKPYSGQETKKVQVRRMFDNIASNYDLLNRILSFGIDRYWRKVLIKRLKKQRLASADSTFEILDMATGTADLPIMIVKNFGSAMDRTSICGADLSPQMLHFGKIKIDKLKTKNHFAQNITLKESDAEQLDFKDNGFDAVTAVFGVRNFGNKAKGLEQMYRVCKPQGRLYILEFGMPKNKIIAALYGFYFCKMLPAVGGLISKDFKAYDYLPKSVESFPPKQEFCKMLEDAGFEDVSVKSLTFGVSNLYCGNKN